MKKIWYEESVDTINTATEYIHLVDTGALPIETLVFQAYVISLTPPDRVFGSSDVSVANNTLTHTATHDLYDGQAVTATTSGTLPGGLATSTTYYVIRVNAASLKLATSRANALAGVAIDLTTQGTGNHTLVVPALSGCSIGVEHSNDGETFFEVSGSTTALSQGGIGAGASLMIELSSLKSRYYRVKLAITTGTLSSTVLAVGKGDF